MVLKTLLWKTKKNINPKKTLWGGFFWVGFFGSGFLRPTLLYASHQPLAEDQAPQSQDSEGTSGGTGFPLYSVHFSVHGVKFTWGAWARDAQGAADQPRAADQAQQVRDPQGTSGNLSNARDIYFPF